jgi:hypothetical protein
MSISILNADELAHVMGGVTVGCQSQLPAPEQFTGTKAQQLTKAVSKYALSPSLDLRDEANYMTSRAPGTTQNHVDNLCKTTDGRQYLSDVKGVYDRFTAPHS